MNILATVAIGAMAGAGIIFLLHLLWRMAWGPPAINEVPILAYHRVDDRFELGGTWNTPGQFLRQMRWLRDNGYGTVTMAQAAEMMAGGQEAGRTVCLTFDDAYQGLYHHVLPVLRQYGFTATVFVVAGFVGRDNEWDINWGGRRFRHLDWEQLQEMAAAGVEIGSHGMRHRDLRRLSVEQLKDEVQGSKEVLEKNLGLKVRSFCYPFGLYDERVQEVVRRAGYDCACSISPGRRNAVFDKYALRRTGVYITDILWDFRHKVDHHSTWFWVQDLWTRTVNLCSRGSAFTQRTKGMARFLFRKG